METVPLTSDAPRASYLDRVARHEQLRDQARAASLKISTLRAVTFVGTAAALVVAVGLMDQWMGLRKQYGAPPGGQEKE